MNTDKLKRELTSYNRKATGLKREISVLRCEPFMILKYTKIYFLKMLTSKIQDDIIISFVNDELQYLKISDVDSLISGRKLSSEDQHRNLDYGIEVLSFVSAISLMNSHLNKVLGNYVLKNEILNTLRIIKLNDIQLEITRQERQQLELIEKRIFEIQSRLRETDRLRTKYTERI